MGLLEELPQTQPKVLFFDLETSPEIGAYFGKRYETRIADVLWDWRVLCVGYRWSHWKKAKCFGQPDGESYRPNAKPFVHMDDREVVEFAWSLLDDADIVVGHNSIAFDEKKLNARFIELGLGQPAPYKSVDTLKIARGVAGFSSNRLDDLGEYLGLGRKHPSGYELWKGCMEGDRKKWAKMQRYCRRDVDLLVELYLKLFPWAKTHPHVGLMSGNPDGCRKCGGELHLTGGLEFATTRAYPVLQCQSCGAFSKSRKSLPDYVAAAT